MFNVGMFKEGKAVEELSYTDKQIGYERYINALSVSVRGTGAIFLKRNPKDVFTNNFNRRLMSVHKANHDIQMVIDQVSYSTSLFLLIKLFSVCSSPICDWLFDQK